MRASILALALVAGAGPALAAEHVVQMENIAYAPMELKAKVGDTIRFVNADGTNHAVFVATAGHGVDLGMQKPKAETKLTLGKEGRFEVECVNHPNMRLVVVVTK
jgi:plastocyanin